MLIPSPRDTMKVLMINGSPNEKRCTYTALSEMAKIFDQEKIEYEIFWIGKGNVPGCTSCGACRKKGACVIDDEVNKLGSRLDDFDAIVVGSPVYYAGPSGQITAFLDRLFYSHGKKMAGKLGASVVSCRRGGATAAFDRLNKYFTICNMPIVSSNYWNQVHGNSVEEVMQDLEGLQTMRVLAQNISWLLKCIEAGKKNGVDKPTYEAKVLTNFIR